MAELNELSEDTKKVLYECFQHYDTSGDGIIDIDELPEALRFAGINPRKEDLNVIINLFDTNGDGKLQISELVDNWNALCQHSVNGSELLDAFHTIDSDKDGLITLKQLRIILTKTGDKMSPEDAGEFENTLMKYTKRKDGKFSYPDFVAMWASDVLPPVKSKK